MMTQNPSLYRDTQVQARCTNCGRYTTVARGAHAVMCSSCQGSGGRGRHTQWKHFAVENVEQTRTRAACGAILGRRYNTKRWGGKIGAPKCPKCIAEINLGKIFRRVAA